MKPRKYTIIICADADKEIKETDEKNNCSRSHNPSITVVGTGGGTGPTTPPVTPPAAGQLAINCPPDAVYPEGTVITVNGAVGGAPAGTPVTVKYFDGLSGADPTFNPTTDANGFFSASHAPVNEFGPGSTQQWYAAVEYTPPGAVGAQRANCSFRIKKP